MNQSLRGQIAFITGAGRGIGRAVAVGLANEGCDVARLARSAKELEETARLCANAAPGVRTLCLPADIADADAFARAIEECAQTLGGLPNLVNNAGIFDWADADQADLDTRDRLVDVNLRDPARAPPPAARR